MIHDVYFRQLTLISGNAGNKLSCPDCRLPWNSNTIYSYIEWVKQDNSQVEDVDVIVDDHNPDIIIDDLNPDIVDDTELCFGTNSLNPFHCIIYKNVYCQDNQMFDIILLGEHNLDYLLDENTIFQLQSFKYSLFNWIIHFTTIS